jgi:hypothetical protein
MKLWIVSLIVLFALQLSAQSTSPSPNSSQVIVIRAGTLIDPGANQPKHDQVIMVRGNKI